MYHYFLIEQSLIELKESIAENIAKFAEANDLQIHPGQESLKWAELVVKHGGCPCVRVRKGFCPCRFVFEDIKEIGRCRCGLFCDEAYLEEYHRLTSKKR